MKLDKLDRNSVLVGHVDKSAATARSAFNRLNAAVHIPAGLKQSLDNPVDALQIERDVGKADVGRACLNFATGAGAGISEQFDLMAGAGNEGDLGSGIGDASGAAGEGVSSATPTYQGSAVSPGSSWSVAGIGDFTGDGNDDILWRNSTGSLAMWLMDGSTIESSATPTYQGGAVSPGSSWSVAGIGDFNGNGDADILWRNSNGSLAMWLMDGSTISSSATPTYQGSAVSPGAPWSIAGIGDFNGDGEADILWRNSNGSLAMWLMDGSTIESSATPTYQGSAVSPDSSWNIVEIGDFNGSGNFDILWQQSTTGALAEWQMNGSQIVSSQSVTSQGTPVAPPSTWTSQAKPTDFA